MAAIRAFLAAWAAAVALLRPVASLKVACDPGHNHSDPTAPMPPAAANPDPNHAGASTTPWYWTMGAQGVECTKICESKGSTCSEDGMRSVDSPEGTFIMALGQLMQCELSYGLSPGQFPAVTPTGRCQFTYREFADNMNDGNTCNVTPWVFFYRYCPCMRDMGPAHHHPKAQRRSIVSPRHATNIRGEHFDVLRTGQLEFLSFPRQAGHTPGRGSRLRVVARVDNAFKRPRCDAFYASRLSVTGSLVPEGIEVSARGRRLGAHGAIQVKYGNQTMRSSADIAGSALERSYNMTFLDERGELNSTRPHDRVKFAHLRIQVGGVQLMFHWSTGKNRPNSLDFRAGHLKKLGKDWGGILGDSDHTWLSTGRHGRCAGTRKWRRQKRQRRQLSAARRAPPEPWFAVADLE